MDLSQVRAVCEAAMREYGMPSRIRTDMAAAGAALQSERRGEPLQLPTEPAQKAA
jgi:hypothetical protein